MKLVVFKNLKLEVEPQLINLLKITERKTFKATNDSVNIKPGKL